FPQVSAAHTVAAVSAQGFGRTRARNGNAVAITLQPFGEIRGVVVRDGSPVAKQEVVLSFPPTMGSSRSVHFDFESFRTRADGEGRFHFTHVPAGDLSIHLNHGIGIPMTDRTRVVVTPGYTVEVIVGELMPGHQRVIGRLRASDPGAIRDWPKQVELGSIYRELPAPPVPAGLSEEESDLWLLDWSETDEGREQTRLRQGYPLKIEKDGSFGVANIPPGDYRMILKLISAEFIGQSIRALRYGGWIGEAGVRFTVPGSETTGNSVHDLGEITVQVTDGGK
ncbi:MAG: hypothetical protein KIT18_09975, partial [Burkholderiales bacterium]|nr:hypothetical protein [Burkholderiales bacterium]